MDYDGILDNGDWSVQHNVDQLYAKIHSYIDELQYFMFQIPSASGWISLANQRVVSRLQKLDVDASTSSEMISTATNHASTYMGETMLVFPDHSATFRTPQNSCLWSDGLSLSSGPSAVDTITDSATEPVESAMQSSLVDSNRGMLQEDTNVDAEAVSADVEMPAQKSTRRSSIVEKSLSIADNNSRTFAISYAKAICTTGDIACSSFLPNHDKFPLYPIVNNGPELLQSIPRLSQAIEYSSFGEQHCRIWKRISLAHYFHSYSYAQSHSDKFLQWYREQQITALIPKGTTKSIIAHCFANLILLTPSNAAHECQRTRLGKVQTWRKSGKPWAKLIDSFGYGILLLIPSHITDEDFRQAREDELDEVVDNLCNRKEDFSQVLHVLNKSFETFFTSNNQSMLHQPATDTMVD